MTTGNAPTPSAGFPPRKAEHEDWLRSLTALPTVAGVETAVIGWVDRWLAERRGLTSRRDEHGNIEIALAGGGSDDSTPVYFTAHLDHPGFVVERVIGPATVELAFRGGVMDDYFPGSRVSASARDGTAALGGVVTERGDQSDPFKSWIVELDEASDTVQRGDLAVWELDAPEVLGTDSFGREVEGGCLHARACDDLAAVAAALAALDALRERRAAGEPTRDARVLLTRAEEIGFIGAIGASRDGFMPAASRVIALENSRSFLHDSPIGGGPIVRVGDRINTFSPGLTAAVARAAEKLAGRSAHATAVEKEDQTPSWRWQRKLMAGGACEASVFCSFGYEATCVCLPLGNYHNMADLDAVQAGTSDGPPRIERECIALADYHGMIDLLVACGLELPEGGGFRERAEKLWESRKFVLG